MKWKEIHEIEDIHCNIEDEQNTTKTTTTTKNNATVRNWESRAQQKKATQCLINWIKLNK